MTDDDGRYEPITHALTIYRALRQRPLTIYEIAALVGVSHRTAIRLLRAMREAGIAITTTVRAGTRSHEYRAQRLP